MTSITPRPKGAPTGGSNLVRGTATANGDYEEPATAPTVEIGFEASNYTEFYVQIDDNGTIHQVTASATNPANGSYWIDSTSIFSVAEAAEATASALGSSGVTAAVTGETVVVTSGTTGSSSTLTCTTSNANFTLSAGGDGGLVSASGPVNIIPMVVGKKCHIVSAYVTHNGNGAWTLMDSDSEPLATGSAAATRQHIAALTTEGVAHLISGTDISRNLQLDSEGLTTVWLIAEQY